MERGWGNGTVGLAEGARIVGICCMVLSLYALACSKPRYHVEVGQMDNIDCEIRDYHTCLNADCSSFSVSPAFQEVEVGGSLCRVDGSREFVREVFAVDDETFVLIRNNFGYHVARLCAEGHFEYAADLLEVPIGDYRSMSINETEDSRFFLLRVEYASNQAVSSLAVVEKQLFIGNIFGGCSPIDATHQKALVK